MPSSPKSAADVREGDLKPIVGDASTVWRQVIRSVEPVVTDHGNLRNTRKIGQPQVDPHGAPPIVVVLQASPVRHAATDGAKMKHDPSSLRIGSCRPRDVNAVLF